MSKTLSRYRNLAIELEIWNKRNFYPATFLCIVQLFLAFLDLAAVGLMTLSIAIASSSFTRGSPGDLSKRFLDFFELQNFDLRSQVVLIGIAAIVLLIGKTFLSLGVFRISLDFVQKRTNELSSSLIRQFFQQSADEILSASRQKSIWTLTSGTISLSMGVYKFFLGLSADIILILVIFVGLATIDLVTASLALFIFASSSMLAYGIINGRTVKISREKQNSDIVSSQKLQDLLALYKELIVRNENERHVDDVIAARSRFIVSLTRIQFFQSISKYLMEIVLVVSIAALGAYVIAENDLSRSIALFTLFLAGSGRMLPAILRLQSSFLAVNASVSGADETLRLLKRLKSKLPYKSVNSPPSNTPKDFSAKVVFEKVHFRFKEGKQIIKNLDFDIDSGSFFGIVGTTGVGKSTLLDLMLGLRTPTAGKISISGLEPRDAFVNFPGKVAYVPQEIRIIGGSILGNLTLNQVNIPQDDRWIMHLMKMVKLEDLVKRFGLRETLGENDFALSGGQRQRLGIARAMVTRPKLLILDEATSALDYETEIEILRKLRSFRGLTIVLVTHRIQTLKHADKILFMGKRVFHSVGDYGDLRKFIGGKAMMR